MPKSRPYYSLLERAKNKPDGLWSIQFGDYSRAVVWQEREDRKYSNGFEPKSERLEFHILKTDSDRQDDIEAAVRYLNDAALRRPVPASFSLPRK